MTLPSGRVVTTTYDPAGRPAGLQGVFGTTGRTYAGSIGYAPHGALSSMVLGDPAGATVSETRQYNSRLQLTEIKTGSLLKLDYDYGTTNNGNPQSQTITQGGQVWTQSYGYTDGVNRLTSANETASGSAGWTQTYGYDSRGNWWVSGNTGLALSPFTPSSAANYDSSNRLNIQGSTYDAAGNQKTIGSYGFTYDAENRAVTASLNGVTTYSYDGDGRRVLKQTGAGSSAVTTAFVYDAFGVLAGEYASGPQPALSCTTCLVTVDYLGSTRMLTDASSGTVAERHDFLPFGEELFAGTNGRTTGQGFPASGTIQRTSVLFTGQYRDAELESSAMPSGLDYFGARYFSSAQGRFTNPDPLMASAHASNPQTWNRYTYGLNNPLRYFDPDGLDVSPQCAEDKNCQIVVKVNVIYDKTVHDGNGLTKQERQAFEKDQLGRAQKDFGNSNIRLQFTYTAGSYTGENDNHQPQVTGLQGDALNVVVSTATPNGHNVSGVLGGAATTFLNFTDVTSGNYGPFQSNSTEHEFGHQFLGDPFSNGRDNAFVHFIQNAGRDTEIDSRNTLQQLGVSQGAYRTGLEPRRYAVPANPEANKPQK